MVCQMHTNGVFHWAEHRIESKSETQHNKQMKKKELFHWKVFHTEKSSVLKSATCQFFHGEFHTIHIHIHIQYSCAQCPILLLKFSLALNTHWNEFKWNSMGAPATARQMLSEIWARRIELCVIQQLMRFNEIFKFHHCFDWFESMELGWILTNRWTLSSI